MEIKKTIKANEHNNDKYFTQFDNKKDEEKSKEQNKNDSEEKLEYFTE